MIVTVVKLMLSKGETMIAMNFVNTIYRHQAVNYKYIHRYIYIYDTNLAIIQGIND